jgi:hypothetical protein
MPRRLVFLLPLLLGACSSSPTAPELAAKRSAVRRDTACHYLYSYNYTLKKFVFMGTEGDCSGNTSGGGSGGGGGGGF